MTFHHRVLLLLTLLPALAGGSKWEHPDYAAAKKENVIFDQKSCVFVTHMLALRSSQVVILKNSDPVGHNANIVAKGKALGGNALIPSGGDSQYIPGGESP